MSAAALGWWRMSRVGGVRCVLGASRRGSRLLGRPAFWSSPDTRVGSTAAHGFLMLGSLSRRRRLLCFPVLPNRCVRGREAPPSWRLLCPVPSLALLVRLQLPVELEWCLPGRLLHASWRRGAVPWGGGQIYSRDSLHCCCCDQMPGSEKQQGGSL